MSERTGQDQFSSLGREYEETEQWPLRQYVEAPTLISRLGDLTGLTVLDAGCGSGFYSRRLALLGANIVGLDASEGMLSVAKRRERIEKLGIRYVHGDLSDASSVGLFDVVNAVYVLPYADTYPRLAAMCRGAREALRPGGRFVAFTLNPDFSHDPDWYAPYGFTLRSEGQRDDGTPVALSATAVGKPFTITAYLWSLRAYEKALRHAGFTAITWLSPAASAEGTAKHGADFWRRYITRPHALLVEARLS